MSQGEDGVCVRVWWEVYGCVQWGVALLHVWGECVWQPGVLCHISAHVCVRLQVCGQSVCVWTQIPISCPGEPPLDGPQVSLVASET